MSVSAQLESASPWAALQRLRDTAGYYFNLGCQAAKEYSQQKAQKSAEDFLKSYLKKKEPILRKYGFVCLLIALSTPFWHVSSSEWNGLLVRRNENGWGFGPISSYNTGLTVFVLIYESLGFLLAVAPSCVTPVLQRYLHRLPRERTARICLIFDGPFVLAGSIVGWYEPVEGASVGISLLLALLAGIFFIPSGILELMNYSKISDEKGKIH